MPFLDYYGSEAEGRWFEIGTDDDSGKRVELRVRSVPASEAERIERKYRRRIKNPPPGARLQSLYMVPDAKKWDQLFDNGCYAWIDCKNFSLSVRDEDGARFMSKELQKNVKIGDVVVLDGKLTDKIKREIFDKKTSILLRVIEIADQLEKEHLAEEAAETENLSTGSNSDSTTEYQKNNAEDVGS